MLLLLLRLADIPPGHNPLVQSSPLVRGFWTRGLCPGGLRLPILKFSFQVGDVWFCGFYRALPLNGGFWHRGGGLCPVTCRCWCCININRCTPPVDCTLHSTHLPASIYIHTVRVYTSSSHHNGLFSQCLLHGSQSREVFDKQLVFMCAAMNYGSVSIAALYYYYYCC